jgi:hypothetical protein
VSPEFFFPRLSHISPGKPRHVPSLIDRCRRQTTWKLTIPKQDRQTFKTSVLFALWHYDEPWKGDQMMIYISALFLLLTAGCTAHPYTVCRGEDYCTPALSHEEAIRASEIKKTWQDEKLYVRPVKNKEAT